MKDGSPAGYVRAAETVPAGKAYPESGSLNFLRNLVREIHVDFGNFLKFPLCGFKKHKVSHADRSPSPFFVI